MGVCVCVCGCFYNAFLCFSPFLFSSFFAILPVSIVTASLFSLTECISGARGEGGLGGAVEPLERPHNGKLSQSGYKSKRSAYFKRRNCA